MFLLTILFYVLLLINGKNLNKDFHDDATDLLRVPATIVMKTYMKLKESKLEMKYVLKEQMGRMILILNQNQKQEKLMSEKGTNT